LVGEVSDFTSTSYTVSSGVTAGTTYKFKVRAKNFWGWGTLSTEFSITASAAPAQMATVTTSIDAATGGLKISWSEPADNEAAID